MKIKNKRNFSKGLIVALILFSLLIAIILYFIYKNAILSILACLVISAIPIIFVYTKKNLEESAKMRNMENVFPDFLQLMASNLRAGMTISKAMLLSSREEFAPLDKEILRVGKDITTGKEIETALIDMSERIKSKKIHKTILLIISGLKAGGNLAVLLEETASNMKERNFVEKRAASNTLMYVIFIFVAVALAAPILFGLSNVLVSVLTNILSKLPSTQAYVNVPFTLTKVNISTEFINYFSLSFILMLDVLASLVLGLINKGEEKEGLRFLIPILILSYGSFFLTKMFLSNFLAGFF